MPTSPPQTEHHLRQGFTLVEVLVGLVLLAITSAVLARILQGSIRVRQHQQEEVRFLQEQAEAQSLQFSGQREDPLVTLEPIEDAE